MNRNEHEDIRDQSFRDSISTVDEEGKRSWVFAKKPTKGGKWLKRREIYAYSFLIILAIIPFIKVNGEPFFMINIVERKFIIFSYIFWPEDSFLFALGLISFMILIIVFTVVFGRLFCGWACPQTIFLEMIFRKIEFWIDGDWNEQKKLDKMPWKGKKLRKRLFKWAIYWVISFGIANLLLSYIIGVDALKEIITDSPKNHIKGLIAITVFTFVFFAVFTWFREQVCIAICPYGRLQGVLLDQNSVVVAYDYVRGEGENGRAKFRKNEDRKAEGKGDCIDCGQCVHVCPTGIDIRNGTQLECVNCTLCMDACDFMMDKVGLEQGLIRYDSEKSIKTGVDFKLSGRAKAYIVLMFVILGILISLLFTRTDIEATILRVPKTSYQKIDSTHYSNLYNVTLINKTAKDMPVEFKMIEGNAEIEIIGDTNINLKTGEHIDREIMVKMDKKDLVGPQTPIVIGVYSNGELVEERKVRFSGPGY